MFPDFFAQGKAVFHPFPFDMHHISHIHAASHDAYTAMDQQPHPAASNHMDNLGSTHMMEFTDIMPQHIQSLQSAS